MSREQIEFNKRQISLVEKKLQDYLENKIHIDWLIKDLEAWIKSIIDCSKEWIEEFTVLINELELYYADALYEKRTNFNSAEKIEILQVLKSMEILIKQYKKQNLPDLEDE